MSASGAKRTSGGRVGMPKKCWQRDDAATRQSVRLPLIYPSGKTGKTPRLPSSGIAKKHFNVNRNFLNRFSLIWAVQSLIKKDSGFPNTQITCISLAIPFHLRGVSRSSRTLERDAVDVDAPLTNGVDADGEVVWS
jgi:hypothetical protein